MTDVVVAGAGPVGLMLACELRLAGAGVVVLERNTEIDPTIKAGFVTVPGIEALDRRGLAPALTKARDETLARFGFAGRRPDAPRPRFLGHFGAMMLDSELLDTTDPEIAGSARFVALGMVTQQQLEAILEDRARELGADVRRGVTMTGFTQDASSVTVTTDRGPIEAGWLVGCDGGRSLVRKLAGFDFPGTPPEITAYQAIADMENTEGLRPSWNITDTGAYAFGPFPGRILVAEFEGAPADRTSPVTPAELEGAIRRVTGVGVTVTGISSVTRFTDNARQVTDYRSGRVLLAGDAAHVHSPFGGQGINLGLGDAMNLGWKLGATVRGWAPPGLLDTYTAERHPIGAWVLDWTRAQIAIMRPDRHARALRAVLGDLASTVDGTTYFATRISGVRQGYDLPGDHPLIGRSAPDLLLDDGTRPADHLHTGRALLLDLTGDPALRAAATGHADRLTVHTAKTDDQNLTAIFVRPDGYVAWAATDGSTTGLPERLTAWLGA
ncbi:FAD-dependent monooxygenase [Actinoplanes sp. L3-i22]|uniref:FAD-dependent monooxygenase n=1 Tax=Actinoplanes sp. L3-i22 TaxID=2836373 RepID=UPI001C75A008|nr:FAD-dependent monooxygenase [Actinoplanes sp. L3-i22]BCY10518.1 FAD-dependent oxidoreductase [Actinoplanes sp. L3-i22]